MKFVFSRPSVNDTLGNGQGILPSRLVRAFGKSWGKVWISVTGNMGFSRSDMSGSV